MPHFLFFFPRPPASFSLCECVSADPLRRANAHSSFGTRAMGASPNVTSTYPSDLHRYPPPHTITSTPRAARAPCTR